MPLEPLQKVAAAAVGVTPAGLRNWMKEPGFPDCSAGYDVDAIRRWVQDRKKKGSSDSDLERQLAISLKAERLRREKIRTRREQLALEMAEGLLIERKAIETAMSIILSSLGDWCEQLPDLAVLTLPRELQEPHRLRLKKELDQMRMKMADDLRGMTPGR